ncbi:MAG: heavy metal translocating P-type ATPase metal-binding domain-containing protein [Planctomycetes bacterium]|nr:heavy metal translocating P-type ATPase metal-binding domain-containing protein [Planctomycetota bacterium]
MPAERRSEGSSSFCCSGCEAVHALLVGEGLERFYELGGQASGAVGEVPRVPRFDWFDDAETRATVAGEVRLTLDVQGIRCAACVWLLRALWQRLPGARELRIDPSLGRATLVYDRDSAAGKVFLPLCARFGYLLAPASRRVARDSGLMMRFGICAAIAMNAMILAVSLYFGLDGAGSNDEVALREVFGWVLLALATGSVLVGGPVFFRSAWAGVRAGVVHMDLPISLGIALAFGGSLFGQLTGGPAYFDAVAIFVALMLGGRFLQARTLARSRDLVLADDGAEHLRARVVRDGRLLLVPVTEVRAGDELVLAPGDLVPVRVRLLGGEGSFSLDWINGESEPRAFAVTDEIPAGAFQADRAALRVVAVASYVESGLAELLGQGPIDREDTRGRVRFWERLNRFYATGVLVAAGAAAAIWAFVDPARVLPVTVSVLVVTCPCALGIATPLAFHLAMARLRRRGVFVRTKSLLDKLRRVRHVVFDKTGTLTLGGLRARAVRMPTGRDLEVLATMTASSNHPVSSAVLAALPVRPFRAEIEVREILGTGLECEADGHCYRLAGGEFRRDGEVIGEFELAEDYRDGAREEIAWLRARGAAVYLLSGDRGDRTRRAAEQLGIAAANARGGMSAGDKARAIAAIDDDDTLMIGDGLNDSPAFAAAFCAGTPAMDRPVLPARSDFCFRGEGGGAVRAVFEVADLHGRIVRSNLALALAYNLTALSVCFAALMTPALCAVLMPASSVALVLHVSLRFRRAGRTA